MGIVILIAQQLLLFLVEISHSLRKRGALTSGKKLVLQVLNTSVEKQFCRYLIQVSKNQSLWQVIKELFSFSRQTPFPFTTHNSLSLDNFNLLIHKNMEHYRNAFKTLSLKIRDIKITIFYYQFSVQFYHLKPVIGILLYPDMLETLKPAKLP